MIKKKPFVNYTLDEDKKEDKRKIVTVSLNLEELKSVTNDMKLIRQDQLGKAIKQFMKIGQIVLHDEKMGKIINTLFINKTNSERKGIKEF